MEKKFLLIFCMFIFIVAVSPVLSALDVPLSITDYTGVGRVDEPVTSGIPLPENSGITSTNSLKITNSQGQVPAQFTVLSRWGGTPEEISRPIKWVLLDFQADVPASSTVMYNLKDGGSGSPSTSLSVQEDSSKIIINTGKAKFQISKNYFNLFDYIWIDSDNDGQLDDKVVDQLGQGGLVLKDRNGKEFRTIYEPPEEIIVEEQGPLRSVVKIRGVFKAQDSNYFAPSISDFSDSTKANLNSLGYAYGNSFSENQFSQPYQNSIFYYNARIHFYNEKDYVRVFLTLENNGANGRTNPEQDFAPIQVVYFDSVYLNLKTTMSSTDILSEDSSTNLGSSDTFTLYQDWSEDLQDGEKTTLETIFANGPYYQTKRNTQQLSSGSTNPGWVDMNGNSKGLGLAMRHFWQNFPKKLVFSPSQVRIGLWPEEGYYPYCQAGDSSSDGYGDNYCTLGGRDAGVYLFDGGRHKTHEFVLRFYPGSQDGETKKLSQRVESPLMALASTQWYTSTRALGMIAPYGLTSGDSEINEAMERFELLQSANLYGGDSGNGRTILNIRTSNPPHWETNRQGQFFGWMNFGDMIWSNKVPSALHYDWTYSMFLHYIRSGKRSFFDTGVEMAKHRYDIDQYHGERTSTDGRYKWNNYLQYYESSGHADPTVDSYHPSKVSYPSHTWNEGLVLYYLLTGDKKSWEAAVENGKAALNYYGTGGLKSADAEDCAIRETRHETWAMLNLINLYRVSGDPEYLRVAKNIAKNRMLTREEAAGGQGFFGYGGDTCASVTPGQWSLFFAYGIEPMISTHYETQDQELEDLLIRMADWARNDLLFGGDYDGDGNYRPLQMSDSWTPSDPEGSSGGWNSYIVKIVFLPDLFAYAYKLTGQNVYLDWARKSFRDSLFYYTAGGRNYISSDYRSIISYIDGMFSNSHTKVHGWIGRTNQVYLFTEWELDQPVCTPGPGEVCCLGIKYTGNCCSNLDCTAPQVCIDHMCTTESHYCSDGNCDADEDCSTCPADCGSCSVCPSGVYRATKLTASPVIDGNIEEFAIADKIVLTQPLTGSGGEYMLMWNEEGLYIAASVTDSNLNADITQRDGQLWKDDSIETMFDTMNDGGASQDSDDYKFLLNLWNVARDSNMLDSSWDAVVNSGVVLTGTLNDNTDTDTGYTIEIAIPWSGWGITSPTHGSRYGFELVLNDQDETGAYNYDVWSNSNNDGNLNDPVGWGEILFSHCADTDCDGCIGMVELMPFIGRWKNNEVDMTSLMDAIGLWKAGC